MTYNLSAMRILYVADGRSPIAQNWIRHFAHRAGYVLGSSEKGLFFAATAAFTEREMRSGPADGGAPRQPDGGGRAAKPIGRDCPLFQGLDSRA